jgi:hypothetical protein
MLQEWLTLKEREQAPYQFRVVDFSELDPAGEDIALFLGHQLLLAHSDREKIREDYQILIEDIEEVHLDILKEYIHKEILPSRKITRVGNFGEVLAAAILIDFEGFWLPIYKLRFREKRDWAMRLTDLCLFHVDDINNPLVCYGEVKTKSSGPNPNIAVEGHESIRKDDALSDAEILRFISDRLREAGRLEEYKLITRIRLGKISYRTRHDLFIIHDKAHWKDNVLDNLNACQLDSRLVDFSVRVILIEELARVIESAYDKCDVAAMEIISG